MTNEELLEPATALSSAGGRGAGRRAWRVALVVSLAAGLAPTLGNALWVGGGWISEGGQYLEDLPGLVISTVLEAVPFVALAVGALQVRRQLGLIMLTIAGLVVVVTNAYGYGVVFFPGEDSSSTDALIFVVIVPLQWVVAAAAGVVMLLGQRRRPVPRWAP